MLGWSPGTTKQKTTFFHKNVAKKYEPLSFFFLGGGGGSTTKKHLFCLSRIDDNSFPDILVDEEKKSSIKYWFCKREGGGGIASKTASRSSSAYFLFFLIVGCYRRASQAGLWEAGQAVQEVKHANTFPGPDKSQIDSIFFFLVKPGVCNVLGGQMPPPYFKFF